MRYATAAIGRLREVLASWLGATPQLIHCQLRHSIDLTTIAMYSIAVVIVHQVKLTTGRKRASLRDCLLQLPIASRTQLSGETFEKNIEEVFHSPEDGTIALLGVEIGRIYKSCTTCTRVVLTPDYPSVDHMTTIMTDGTS